MPKAAGYIESSLSPEKAFSTCLSALRDSKFKYVAAYNSELLAKYKTSSSLMNNSWGEKIEIVVTEEKNNGSTLWLSSENLGGAESLHKENVETIIDLFQKGAKKEKDVVFRESGLIPASAIAGATTTTSWFAVRTEGEEGEEAEPDGDSGFNFFG